MVTSDTLRKLAALSLSAEQMAGVLNILADDIEKEEKRKESQAERKRRQRAKSQDSHGTVTGQSQDSHDKSPPPSSPLLPSPTPPSNNPPITPLQNLAGNAGTPARGVNLINPEKPILEINSEITGQWKQESCDFRKWEMNLAKAAFDNFAEKMASHKKTPQAWKLAWVKWYSNEFYTPPSTGQPAYQKTPETQKPPRASITLKDIQNAKASV